MLANVVPTLFAAKGVTSDYRRIGRWEDEAVLDKGRLDANPEAMRI